MNPIIRVILADDHPLIRTGMRLVLAEEPDIQIVGEASSGAETIQIVSQTAADILLLDLSMPGMSAMEVVQAVQAIAPKMKIIVVSAYDDEAIVQAVIHAGVVGYVLKDEAEALLGDGIRTVYRGATWFSSGVMHTLTLSAAFFVTQSRANELTLREQEILRAIALGASNQQIALRLNLAEQTIRNYITRIYEKLGVSSRAEAIIWAFKNGLGKQTH
jgi:DNA-binding NarL/FixJ family response regulator